VQLVGDTISVNSWFHVATVYSSKENLLKLYINKFARCQHKPTSRFSRGFLDFSQTLAGRGIQENMTK
jgi:hypothetical protein